MLLKHPIGVSQLAEGAQQEELPPPVMGGSTVNDLQDNLVKILSEQNARLQAQLSAEQEKKQKLEEECLNLAELNYELVNILASAQMQAQTKDAEAKGIKPSKLQYSIPQTRVTTSPQHPKTQEPSSPSKSGSPQPSPPHSPTKEPSSPTKSGSPQSTSPHNPAMVLRLPYPTDNQEFSQNSSSGSFLSAFWSKPQSAPDISVYGATRRRFGVASKAKRSLSTQFAAEEQDTPNKKTLPDGERIEGQRSVSL